MHTTHTRILAVLALLSASTRAAATLTVTTNGDTGAGTELRSIVAAAASGDAIVFDAAVTNIALTAGAIAVGAKDLTIDGGGTVTIDGSGNSSTGLIFNSSGRTWVLDGLTFDGFNAGTAHGGAVRMTDVNDYDMTIRNCTFSNNTVAAFNGGALATDAGRRWTLTMDNCVFSNNRALADNRNGGAIHLDSRSGGNLGTATITNCTFTDNDAGQHGGAILNNDATMIMNDCIFTDNLAGTGVGNDGEGGAIYFTTDRTVSSAISDCQFSGNKGRHGGALRLAGRYLGTFTGCTFTGNQAAEGGNNDGGGGALYYATGSAAVLVTDVVFTDCTFTGNTANRNLTGVNGGVARQVGGAWTFDDCLFSGNQATAANNVEGGVFYVDDNGGNGGGLSDHGLSAHQ